MELFGDLGYLGLFIGTFLAATVVPFSSDFLIIGVLVAGANPLLAFILATVGNWLGGLTSYYLGHLGKWEWIEKWLRVKEESLNKHKSKIEKYGSLIALLSWAPFVGDIFAIGLGFYRVDFLKSAVFMFIGKALRFAFWIGLYFLMGESVLSLKFF
ncbi:Inner membrane protein YqaA [bioreactor metagenome]|uniref:Inner membrane protein YqaA n=1 Tax=bioreactor metagenome TaxID=1076179 RepID=A0A645B928_9ZZZZ